VACDGMPVDEVDRRADIIRIGGDLDRADE
jgi:hypothetical protein